MGKEGAGVAENGDPNPVGELNKVSSAMHMLNEVRNCRANQNPVGLFQAKKVGEKKKKVRGIAVLVFESRGEFVD